MKIISISSEREYEVKVGISWHEELKRIHSQYEQVLIVVPEKVNQLFPISSEIDQYAHVKLVTVPDGEAQKDFATVTKIWDVLAHSGFTRSDAIVGIGGGATTDLAGFAAATWLRGIDWFAMPTTLAGMVDASVGGKTGINSPAGKNLIGSFHSPVEVLIDLGFLPPLSDRDFAAGLAEVIKTGFISDIEILNILSGVVNIDEARAFAYELIVRSISVKAKVVSEDFKEGKLREILNFGHTFGHAVEKDSQYQLRHGEAVAIGLNYALELSHKTVGLTESLVSQGRDLLLKFSLPVKPRNDNWESFLDIMRSDKKSRGKRLRFIGVSQFGQPEWIESVSEEVLFQTYERISR